MCLSTCAEARCGDGLVFLGVEACDDGDDDDGPARSLREYRKQDRDVEAAPRETRGAEGVAFGIFVATLRLGEAR